MDTESVKTRTQANHQKMHGTPGGLKIIVYEQKDVFWLPFWVNNFFKIINLFAIFASEDGKQLLSHNMKQFSSFVRKNVPRMRRMRK